MIMKYEILILLNLLVLPSLCSSNIVYNTSLGVIIGTQISLSGGTSVVQLAGIPYATAARWQHSQLWTSPLPTSPFDATQFGPACAQSNTTGWPYQSEDCLFLNIWTPAPTSSAALYPVLLYIHGGGWFSGSGSEPLYWGWDLVARSNIVLVTFNYRLGAFGWLRTPQENANFGFSDQNNAILWVSTYIKQFGGDPERITLAGQSAGGLSVSFHLTANRLLFSKAIIHSAPSDFPALTPQQADAYYTRLATQLSCQSDDSILSSSAFSSSFSSSSFDCLLAQNTSSILAVQARLLPTPVLPADRLQNVLPWSPVVDGVLVNYSVPLFAFPTLLQASNAPLSKIQVLWGFDKNDTGAWVTPARNSRVAYTSLLKAFFGANSSVVARQYPFPEATLMSTDFAMACPTLQALSVLAEGGLAVAGWTFVHSPSTDPWNGDTVSHCAPIMGPCHGEELIFVFGTANATAAPAAFPVQTGASFTSDEYRLSNQMITAWSSWVRSGADPSAQFAWPIYHPINNPQILQFNISGVTPLSNYHSQGCQTFASLGLYSP